jgi:molybdopterin-containing oxidoreductase family molybdopterin binding subunit
MVPVIPPLYESRPDLEIWSELGRRLGFEKYFPEGWTWLDWAKILLPEEILDKIISPNGPWKVPPEIYPEVPYSNGKFPTPSGKLEFWSQKIVDYGKGKEGDWSPLPIYYEPVESPVTNPEISKKYPLIMISTLSPVRTHSQYINLPWMREIEGEPFIEINPEDAKIRGVNNGDLVCVFNDRGKLIVRARVTATIKKGVVNIFNGWWVKDGACPNCLTEVYAGGPRALGKAIFRMDDYSPAGTLDGQSGAYGCCLVEVKKVVQ